MIRRRAFIAGAAAFAATPAFAESRVSAALVFAVDISSSIDNEHWLLQRQGYIDAMLQREVVQAIIDTPQRKIAVTYFEWSGTYAQRIIVPWKIIGSEDDAEQVASILDEKQRPFEGPTGVGTALNFAADLFLTCPWSTESKVIDVSGDGGNNDGMPPELVRDRLSSLGIRINGLPIDWARSHPPAGMTIEQYYRNCIIGGPNAFCMPAANFDTFGYALAAKLRNEVA